MITDICDKTMTPDQLRGFYKLDAKGFKRYITHQELADRMNLSDARVYRSYLFDKNKVSYRQPPRAILRLSWFVTQDDFTPYLVIDRHSWNFQICLDY